jgi:signal transduction histidine kinase
MTRRDRIVDGLVTATCLAVAELEAWFGEVHGDPRSGLALLGGALCAALLGRRRAPLLVLVAVLALSALGGLLFEHFDDLIFPGPPLIAAIYSSTRHGSARTDWAAASLTALAVLGAAVQDYEGLASLVGVLVFLLIVLGVPFAAGLGIRTRHERAVTAEVGSEERAAAAAAEERARIARELHDVVGHALSVIAVQAGVERRLQAQAGTPSETLATVERTAREALTEMRRLVGLLRAGDEVPLAPQPRLAELDRLVEQVRAAGLDVAVHRVGEPRALAPGIELSAYRIVQEALTNAVKHAGPARVHVLVRYEPDAVALEVVDDGRGPQPGASGHGLAGMRERVGVLGGEMDAGPRNGGGYAVRVRLPT